MPSPEHTSDRKARPFLKWAGGKGQLITAIADALPPGLDTQEDLVYVEPFAGSGAVMFWMLQQLPNIKQAVINDINPDLVSAYLTVRDAPDALITALETIQESYYRLNTLEEKQRFFLAQRAEFNSRKPDTTGHTALLIFLNKTCFNGLYRVNSRNGFNVPFGKYERPNICDRETILADSKLLQRVIILCGDYTSSLEYATAKAFFYFDPPYRPISRTASFNAYAKESFGDGEQMRLKQFCDALSMRGSQWLLSNSDPRNINPDDDFFDRLYSGPHVYINRVKARRSINSVGSKRGTINEVLICNYPTRQES